MKKLSILLFGLVSLAMLQCNPSDKEKGTPEYIELIKKWQSKRVENLKKETGWLNLVGLYWLKEGENKFGSDQSNDLVFPIEKSEPFMGKLILKDTLVYFESLENVGIKVGGAILSKAELKHDLSGSPTVLEYKTLKWFVIKRGDRYGVRLRDLEAPLLKSFEGIETYPVNSDWRIEAKLEEYNPPKMIQIPTIIGTIEESLSPGKLIFEIDGNKFGFDVQDAGKQYFVVFADLTSGNETYGGGRFIYIDKADSIGRIYVDFNKAYNPPCAFTKYATCPLPPKQNYIKVEIKAGEKNYGEGH